jgi:hypothetical protein
MALVPGAGMAVLEAFKLGDHIFGGLLLEMGSRCGSGGP